MTFTSKIEISTPSDLETQYSRTFNAPSDLVFDAHTQPDLIKKWQLGPPGMALPYCEVDLCVGGRIRYIWRKPDGLEMGMSGVFKEIVRPKRIVHTELFDVDWTGGETLVTTEFAENKGATVLTVTIKHATKEARDNALKIGAYEGLAHSYDALESLLPVNS